MIIIKQKNSCRCSRSQSCRSFSDHTWFYKVQFSINLTKKGMKTANVKCNCMFFQKAKQSRYKHVLKGEPTLTRCLHGRE